MNAIHVCREIGLLDECMLIERAGEGVSCTMIPVESQLEADESASEVQDHRQIVSQNVSFEIESVLIVLIPTCVCMVVYHLHQRPHLLFSDFHVLAPTCIFGHLFHSVLAPIHLFGRI